jgi:site-specific DNA-methyltransferase (adenine-specific)
MNITQTDSRNPTHNAASTGIHGRVIVGNALDQLRAMSAESIDSIVTDPPYEIAFLGRRWDATGVAHNEELWRECSRIIKPGGHLLAFGAPRTYHRLGLAVENGGFEVRDSIHWIYGSGFPHGSDVSKAIDKHRGAERPVVGIRTNGVSNPDNRAHSFARGRTKTFAETTAATDESHAWEGWSTTLKPAHEPIVVARRPLRGTVAENILQHGTGALNIDACRIGTRRRPQRQGAFTSKARSNIPQSTRKTRKMYDAGRWPTNVIFDEFAACELDAQSGVRKSGRRYAKPRRNRGGYTGLLPAMPSGVAYGDSGGASRFFYVAKPSAAERSAGLAERNTHETVKPIALMRYLVRLVTRPGGTVLDPFAGSGTTGCAAALEGMSFIGIELNSHNAEIANERIRHWERIAAASESRGA